MKRWLLAFLLSALLLLAGCGGTASDGASSDAVDGEANDAAASQVLTEGAEALTDDELAHEQEAFASERYDEATGASSSTEVSCFFTSYYDRAEELSLAEFLRYYPNDELLRVDNAEDQAQFEALAQLEDFPFQAEEDYALADLHSHAHPPVSPGSRGRHAAKVRGYHYRRPDQHRGRAVPAGI